MILNYFKISKIGKNWATVLKKNICLKEYFFSIFDEAKLKVRQYTRWSQLKCKCLELNYKKSTEANVTKFSVHT